MTDEGELPEEVRLFIEGLSHGTIERVELEMQGSLTTERARQCFWEQLLLRVAEKFGGVT